MTRYPKYKKTGISWLPEIPEEWEASRFKYAHGAVNVGLSIDKTHWSNDDCDRTFYTAGQKAIHTTFDSFDVGLLTRENDILLSRNGTPYVYYPVKGAIYTDHIIRCSIHTSYVKRFVWYAMQVSISNVVVDSVSIPTWSISLWDSQYLPVPTFNEQKSIVAFLDDKCGKIDKVVAEKEKQIELLKELKQTEIADAVTRGISGAPLVASGIPWLPKIPKGWEVKRAKYLFNKEQRPVEEGDEIVTCFRDGEVTLRKNRRTSGFTEATDYSHYQHICRGDLVIHQMDAFAGSTGVSDSDGMGTPVLSVCTPKSDQVYVCYFAKIIRLMGLNGFIQSLYRGIRERSSDFRFDTLGRQLLPLPPLDEQKKIVEYIEKKVAKIDAAVKGLEDEVAALKEYKQRLISDVVTGQVKV